MCGEHAAKFASISAGIAFHDDAFETEFYIAV